VAFQLKLEDDFSQTKIRFDSFEDDISRFQKCCHDLIQAGVKKTERQKVLKFIKALDNGFDLVRGALLLQDWKMETLIENVRAVKLTIEPNDQSASILKISKDKREKPKAKCYFCQKEGHIKKNCFKFKNKLKSENEPVIMTVAENDSDKWILDSGAVNHVTGNKHLFDRIYKKETTLKVANNQEVSVVGYGDVHLNENVTLKNVYYVPDIKWNLLSVKQIAEKGFDIVFSSNNWKIFKERRLILSGNSQRCGYTLESPLHESQVNYLTTLNDIYNLWHRRLGHIGSRRLTEMIKQKVLVGIKSGNSSKIQDCEGCLKGKMKRKSFPNEGSRSKSILDVVHSDVMGPFQIPSAGGKRYVLTFIDDFSRFSVIYLLSAKSEVSIKIKEYINYVERFTEKKLKCLRTDNGGEYSSEDLEKYLKDKGIIHQKTTPYSPQQNGIAEKKNDTLARTMRSMLYDMNVPLELWGEAIMTANYVLNRVVSRSIPEGKTPYEIWMKKKPCIKDLRVFGCLAFYFIPSENRSKLDAVSKRGMFVGYDLQRKSYRIWCPISRKIIFSRTVKCLENVKWSNSQVAQNIDDILIEEHTVESSNKIDEFNKNVGNDNSEQANRDSEVQSSDLENTSENTSETLRRSTRTNLGKSGRNWNEPMAKYWENINYLNEEDENPKSYSEAINSENSHQWKEAIKQEYDNLIKNETWELVELPKDRKAIGCKWVFKIKRNSDNTIDKYKARLVAQGFSQRKGIDYNETFSPVTRFATIRFLLAYANHYDLEIEQLDVVAAFLNGKIDEDLYMRQPQGHEVKGKEHLICKLKKSIYGIKQAPHTWNETLYKTLNSLGFTKGTVDTTVYQDLERNIIVAVYVDDILVIGKNRKDISEIKNKLSEKFDIVDKGPIKQFLGWEIMRNREEGLLCINQKKYITDILKRFNMENCKSSDIPISKICEISGKGDSSDDMKNIPFREAIGSLMYLMVSTRPDICFAVGKLSRYLDQPTIFHWNAVKKLIRYLKGTLNYGIVYRKSLIANFNKISGYSDSDYGSDTENRKSTSGFLTLYNDGIISWCSKKESSVALSTVEAEYVALSRASAELLWLKNLMGNLSIDLELPIKLYCDNQGAIILSKNPKNHSRAKHIDIKFHHVRDLIKKGIIEVIFTSTNKQVADILTKGVNISQLDMCREGMKIEEFQDRMGVLKYITNVPEIS
jgi:transposase InsO family protein